MVIRVLANVNEDDEYADFEEVGYQEVDYQEVDFEEVYFEQVDFKEVYFEGVDFMVEVDLVGVVFVVVSQHEHGSIQVVCSP